MSVSIGELSAYEKKDSIAITILSFIVFQIILEYPDGEAIQRIKTAFQKVNHVVIFNILMSFFIMSINFFQG